MFSYQNEIRAWHVNIIQVVCFIVKWISLMRSCISCPCRYDCCQFSRISIFPSFLTHRLNDFKWLLICAVLSCIYQTAIDSSCWLIHWKISSTQQSRSSCEILRKVHPVYFKIFLWICEIWMDHNTFGQQLLFMSLSPCLIFICAS